MNSFFIGNVEIEKTAALAPMASVADKSYRLMCKEYGASYLVSEMISSKGLCFGDKKTARLCEIESEERPYALQLFGEDPYYMGKAAYKLNEYSPDIIDINMGCPVPKIVGNDMQRGSKKRKLPCYSEIPCRLGRKQHKCSGVRKAHGAGRGKRRHLSRQDENAVLFRQSRLGYNKAGKRGCEDTRYRQRRRC